MSTLGGWTGKTLRVNLTTRTAREEPTQTEWMGGTGIGYKVLWDEVPPTTTSFSPDNKIVVGVGPVTGSGAPCGGRTVFTCIWPAAYPYDNLVGSGHFGGHFGPELKFAGWDNIIIEGKASSPVWLRIEDAVVTIEDASSFWMAGIYDATDTVNRIMGKEAQVAAIGVAGSNLVRHAVIMTGYSHSAGGVGGVFGSKNLKAIGVKGTGSVEIAAAPDEWKSEVRFALSIIGSNNQHVMPRTWQGWNEYIGSSSRWTSRNGLYWGAADPPVNTGDNRPEQLDRIGYRCDKAWQDLGAVAENYTVRMSGCHACPIRCHGSVDVPTVTSRYGLPSTGTNTCLGWSGGRSWGVNSAWAKIEYDGDGGALNRLEASVVGKHAIDDYGTWCNYGLLQRSFEWAVSSGYLEASLPAEEWAALQPVLEMRANGDPRCLTEIVKIVATKQGQLGEWLSAGPAALAAGLGHYEEYIHDHTMKQWKFGHPYHHGPESMYQVGCLINMQYNRDPQTHSHSNFPACGLPIEKCKEVAEQQFGPGWGAAIETFPYTPINEYKVKYAIWAIERKEIYDSMSLCAWMYPFIPSPLRERNYQGDIGLEARFYTLVTGIETTPDDLSQMGRKFFTLHRALTARQMVASGITDINGLPDTEGVPLTNLRVRHDILPPWTTDNSAETDAPFQGRSAYMDAADMELAKDLFYDELKWNRTNGLPTQACYDELGLQDVAAKMAAEGLLG